MPDPVTLLLDTCPAGTLLKQFLADELEPEDSARIDRHIEACAVCQDRLDEGTTQLPPLVPSIPLPWLALAPRPEGFDVLDQLGVGGMGVVWRVRDCELDCEVALKVMKPEMCDDPDLKRRFLNEARIPARLDHPAIVVVHKRGSLADGRPYYSMKLADRTLDAELQADGAAGTDRLAHLLAIFARVCEGLGYAHRQGVIHRDLKPANIMLGRHGEVLVVDWGIAKVLASAEEVPDGADSFRLAETWHDLSLDTANNSVLGTLAYMAPEQADGRISEVDQRSDVFAMGAILCEILTGSTPYVAKTYEELRRQARDANLTGAFARLDRCGADPAMIQLAKRCLSKHRDERPADAGEVAVVVTRHLNDVRERQQTRKRRPLWVALASSLLVAVGLAVCATLLLIPPTPDPTLRIGIKKWVGYTPLVVAEELDLCHGQKVVFVNVDSLASAENLFREAKIDVVMCPVDWHVKAVSGQVGVDTRVVLMLDDSLEADALVAKPHIRHLRDVVGKENVRIAYQQGEPSEYLLRLLCARSANTPHKVSFDELPLDNLSAEEAERRFAEGGPNGEVYDIVGTYAPHVKRAKDRVPGATLLFSGKDVPSKIVDVLTVRSRVIDKNPDKVEKLLTGWFAALAILGDAEHPRHREAIEIARQFNGKARPGRAWDVNALDANLACSEAEYKEWTGPTQMSWGDREANRLFFQPPANGGKSKYEELFLEYTEFLRPQLRKPVRPEASDGSRVTLELLAKARE